MQHVGDFGRRRDLRGLVHVSENGQAEIVLDAAKNFQSLGHARAAIGVDGGAVGFVVAALEDVGQLQFGTNRSDALGHRAGVGLRFNHAGTGNQKQAVRPAGFNEPTGISRVVLDDIAGGYYGRVFARQAIPY